MLTFLYWQCRDVVSIPSRKHQKSCQNHKKFHPHISTREMLFSTGIKMVHHDNPGQSQPSKIYKSISRRFLPVHCFYPLIRPLHIVKKTCIVLFVHPATQSDDNNDIRHHQQMKPGRWDSSVNHNLAKISNKQVDRIEQE